MSVIRKSIGQQEHCSKNNSITPVSHPKINMLKVYKKSIEKMFFTLNDDPNTLQVQYTQHVFRQAITKLLIEIRDLNGNIKITNTIPWTKLASSLSSGARQNTKS